MVIKMSKRDTHSTTGRPEAAQPRRSGKGQHTQLSVALSVLTDENGR